MKLPGRALCSRRPRVGDGASDQYSIEAKSLHLATVLGRQLRNAYVGPESLHALIRPLPRPPRPSLVAVGDQRDADSQPYSPGADDQASPRVEGNRLVYAVSGKRSLGVPEPLQRDRRHQSAQRGDNEAAIGSMCLALSEYRPRLYRGRFSPPTPTRGAALAVSPIGRALVQEPPAWEPPTRQRGWR
jgi:hypothetical protein